MDYTAGGTCRGQGFLRSLVAVGGGGGRSGVRGPMIYLGQSI